MSDAESWISDHTYRGLSIAEVLDGPFSSVTSSSTPTASQTATMSTAVSSPVSHTPSPFSLQSIGNNGQQRRIYIARPSVSTKTPSSTPSSSAKRIPRCSFGSSITGKCLPCPAGMFIRGNECLPCPRNTFSSYSGSPRCVPCPKNRFAPKNSTKCG